MSSHTMIIKLDEYQVSCAQEQGQPIDLTDHEFWDISVRCDNDPGDWDRDCMTWYECDCKLTEDQRDQLADDEEGPCPTSPTGIHSYQVGNLSPAIPSRRCWAREYDGASDALYDLAQKHKLGPGEYSIHVLSEHEGIEFELEGEHVNG